VIFACPHPIIFFYLVPKSLPPKITTIDSFFYVSFRISFEHTSKYSFLYLVVYNILYCFVPCFSHLNIFWYLCIECLCSFSQLLNWWTIFCFASLLLYIWAVNNLWLLNNTSVNHLVHTSSHMYANISVRCRYKHGAAS
jgi:hypothetical protein